MSAPTVTLTDATGTVMATPTDGTYVTVEWSLPSDTHGSSVLQYQLKFKNSVGTFVADTSTTCEPISTAAGGTGA